ncbi:hypothetical protein KIPB_007143, partial [Kipferlia bialata]
DEPRETILSAHRANCQGICWDPAGRGLVCHLHTYIYIYIYVCVCVVSVRAYAGRGLITQSADRTAKIFKKIPSGKIGDWKLKTQGRVMTMPSSFLGPTHGINPADQADNECHMHYPLPASGKAIKVFASGSLLTFFRRPCFSTDGSLIFFVTGQLPLADAADREEERARDGEDKDEKDKEERLVTNCVMVYRAADFLGGVDVRSRLPGAHDLPSENPVPCSPSMSPSASPARGSIASMLSPSRGSIASMLSPTVAPSVRALVATSTPVTLKKDGESGDADMGMEWSFDTPTPPGTPEQGASSPSKALTMGDILSGTASQTAEAAAERARKIENERDRVAREAKRAERAARDAKEQGRQDRISSEIERVKRAALIKEEDRISSEIERVKKAALAKEEERAKARRKARDAQKQREREELEERHLAGEAERVKLSKAEVRPLAVLPGHRRATISVAACPVLFKRERDEKSAPIGSGDGGEHPAISIQAVSGTPYRTVFAVVSLSDVVVYETETLRPVFRVADSHCASITDVAWSHDGSVLLCSSNDSFVSTITFPPGFLGTPLLTDKDTTDYADEVAAERKRHDARKAALVAKAVAKEDAQAAEREREGKGPDAPAAKRKTAFPRAPQFHLPIPTGTAMQSVPEHLREGYDYQLLPRAVLKREVEQVKEE